MDENALATGEAAAAAPPTMASVDGGDEASRVVRRLERIEALDRAGAPAGQLLSELRKLVLEAEALVRIESGGTRDAGGELREEVEGMR
jgi:hypothetical protein